MQSNMSGSAGSSKCTGPLAASERPIVEAAPAFVPKGKNPHCQWVALLLFGDRTLLNTKQYQDWCNDAVNAEIALEFWYRDQNEEYERLVDGLIDDKIKTVPQACTIRDEDDESVYSFELKGLAFLQFLAHFEEARKELRDVKRSGKDPVQAWVQARATACALQVKRYGIRTIDYKRYSMDKEVSYTFSYRKGYKITTTYAGSFGLLVPFASRTCLLI